MSEAGEVLSLTAFGSGGLALSLPGEVLLNPVQTTYFVGKTLINGNDEICVLE